MSAAETPSDLASILDAYLADLQAGQAPNRAALLAAHPELAAQLESCLAALDFIHRAERPDPTVPPTLGDFRIVREIGRGAWGVVYEAEQISLKRRVALKVLRFGGPADPAAMARFRREAETVAQLHHTNIMPIFAVGCENGVHYFAMQLIAGRSLAAVLKEAQDNKQALDAKLVCGWGVQAAEALAHAHARGVVHRDVKPSNLLLDGAGIVWLADFGLARRHDETAMTVAGAAVGTPRYMSPEQASAVAKPVDQRSDVYSLGATLYELATGRPVFEAATVTELYRLIAESEPLSPRRVREELPRDLETVLLKCLAKEPSQRYATAQELADDLRRVASGDSVRARRPNLLQRLRRWAGQHRRQVRLAAAAASVAVVATLVLVAAGLFGWNAHREAQKGSVILQVEGGSGRGEILGADGKPAVPPFTLPTQAPIELPGGWYHLRVTQPGRLSEDYELFIEQGQHRTFTVGSNDRQLWKPMPIKGTVAGDFGLLQIEYEKGPQGGVVIKRLGKPGKEELEKWKWSDNEKWQKCRKNPLDPAVLWELKLKRQDHPTLAQLEDHEWRVFRDTLMSFGQDGVPATSLLPELTLIQPAPDLDGDGVGDLVFVCGPVVLAISGKEGKVLWCRPLHSNLFRTPTRTWSLLTDTEKLSLLSLSVVQPLPGVTVPFPPRLYTETETALGGPPFVVADIDGDGHPDLILAHGAFSFGGGNMFIRPCVEALSGRTGATLWRHEPASLAERLAVKENEEGSRLKEEVRKGDLSSLWEPKPLTDFASFAERRTEKGRLLLAGLFQELERLDLCTGQTVAPAKSSLSFRYDWQHRGRYVYGWSADGKSAVVLAEGWKAIDTATGADLGKVYPGSTWGVFPGVFADMDGDGVPNIITPERMLNGPLGEWPSKPRWAPRLPQGTGKVDNKVALLVGPDFDGDGCPDLFVTEVIDGERFGHPRGVKVLLAGLRSCKDGRLLWLAAEPIAGSGEPKLHFRERDHNTRKDFAGAVFYWRTAPGTAGYFVVNVERGSEFMEGDGRVAFLFAADTGRLAHVWPGVTVEGVADLDGDGLLDLYGRSGDQLVTVWGTDPEVWRRPGRWRWHWRRRPGGGDDREIGDSSPTYLTGPVRHADLDGDGVADVLLFTAQEKSSSWECQAYSGRDGRPLWTQSRKTLESTLPSYPAWVECLDLEGDKQPVVVMWSEFGECALFDGRTGKLKWQKRFEGCRPRPDLFYRQANGRLALVYEGTDLVLCHTCNLG